MKRDDISEKLEDYFHEHGKRLKLPEEINGSIMVGIVEFVDSLLPDYERLVELLQRLRDWDMMDSAADGQYWRTEIDRVLGGKDE